MARLVFRGGTSTDDNLTPRPGKDTVSNQGRSPGLSVWEHLAMSTAPGGKAQLIDLDLLGGELAAFADDPTTGGDPGHFVIAPIRRDRSIDQDLLSEWAASRGTGKPHRLTVALRGALAGEARRSND